GYIEWGGQRQVELAPQEKRGGDGVAVEMGGQFPPEWQAAVARRLEPGEEALAWFEPDLDAALRYDRGLVVLTDRRLLAAEGRGERWQVWPLAVGISLRTLEQGSAGALEMVGPDSRLGRW